MTAEINTGFAKASEQKPEAGELFKAVFQGNLLYVKSLLKKGANPNETGNPDENGHGKETALSRAAYNERTEIVEALINAGANINTKSDLSEKTALMSAAWKGHTVAMRLLLNSGADINASDNTGETALMYAVKNSFADADTVRLLIKAGADIHTKNHAGETALDLAKSRLNEEITELLKTAANAVQNKPTPPGQSN